MTGIDARGRLEAASARIDAQDIAVLDSELFRVGG